ncbi:5-nitroimidazole antibiotic resistance protein [Trichodelitschia bisporula]|uniref:5-nitroimidazole antibiotic resistance protein n=1 Tax=Trichodelitschia bisporula TaxID=703511 RepID=A0A6G1IB60_9PEZI|nr:5-nitroimidazole antibiotic resistance protein [Trichodelitschia bisporula]
MAESQEYERHPRATVNRLKARGKYDYSTIHTILNSTPILHVSFPANGDDPFPALLPMLGCTGSYPPPPPPPTPPSAPGSFPEDSDLNLLAEDPASGPKNIYLHGHSSARLFRSSAGPLPVTIAATSMQGVVLALSPFHNSCNYASVVVHGYASPVTDEAERLYALTRITDNLVPGRWGRSRNPPTKAEMTTTGVLRVDIASASAKVRVGGPNDDRHDLRDEAVVGSVWTGVVPCWLQFGNPVESGHNKVKGVPSYLTEWVENENERGRSVAIMAVEGSSPK